MNFNSLEFIIFYPIVVLLNFLVPTKYRWIPLLIASSYFYISQSAELFWLIVLTTTISYFSGILIEKKPERKNLWLAISVIASLSVLIFFKYYNFLAETVGALVKADLTLKLMLPVGISFYTFQTLSYSIDVWRGNIKAERHFGYYSLFVCFFPQLVAGPIERPENLLPQLKEAHRFNIDDFDSGLKRMLAGYFKKIVVADMVAKYVDRIFNSPESASGLGVAVAAMLFAVQIYCDFSGYTDIAIGCARIMGYRLMQNFDRPYSAENIKDFWARWHISLTSWFKDYLYIPLGGNRKGKPRMILNLFIVFLVSGLWHGADWTFVLWGALHGIYRVVGMLTYKKRAELWKKLGVNSDSLPMRYFRRAVTFLLVSFAWIFFRANSTSDLIILLGKLFTAFIPTEMVMELTLTAIITIIASFILMELIDRRYTLPESQVPKDGAAIKADAAMYLLWAILFAWLTLKASGGSSAFIYFQF